MWFFVQPFTSDLSVSLRFWRSQAEDFRNIGRPGNRLFVVCKGSDEDGRPSVVETANSLIEYNIVQKQVSAVYCRSSRSMYCTLSLDRTVNEAAANNESICVVAMVSARPPFPSRTEPVIMLIETRDDGSQH